MSVQLKMMSTSPPVLEIVASGKLRRADYEELGPAVEKQIDAHEDIRILLRLGDFDGWTAGALWEDIKFDVKHFNDIDRLAVVGDEPWEKGMAKFCKPFTTAEIRFFTPDRVEQAQQWLGVETSAGADQIQGASASKEAS